MCKVQEKKEQQKRFSYIWSEVETGLGMWTGQKCRVGLTKAFHANANKGKINHIRNEKIELFLGLPPVIYLTVMVDKLI